MSNATDQATPEAVLYELSDGVARVTLNRPAQLNAINGGLHYGLLAALERAGTDPDVRAVVLRGSGRAFSAGGDVKAVAAGEDVGDPRRLGLAIWNLGKPVIAAVHGFCLGQAYELAAICDLTVATESARFGEVEVNHGWGPPLLITPYVVGLKAAKEILLLGELVDATTAQRMGLVNRVVADDGLDEAVRAITDRIVGLKAATLASNKRLVNSAYELASFQEALAQSTQPPA